MNHETIRSYAQRDTFTALTSTPMRSYRLIIPLLCMIRRRMVKKFCADAERRKGR
ncbi:MAG: hypothetical protein RSD07_08380 [Angelakisella sp.]